MTSKSVLDDVIHSLRACAPSSVKLWIRHWKQAYISLVICYPQIAENEYYNCAVDQHLARAHAYTDTMSVHCAAEL